FQIYDSYKRQLEIYGYLLLKNEHQVANYGALYVVKIDIIEETKNSKNNEVLITKEKDVVLIENLDYEKYDEILENLKEVYYSETPPDSHPNCVFCDYFEKRKAL
ncbi:MAG: hypothetical protein NC917_06965, partial [Candidatus Omnitrophica bacterium]|nr:hypothetical protein [Candidatus Omnitrophota bacterium]